MIIIIIIIKMMMMMMMKHTKLLCFYFLFESLVVLCTIFLKDTESLFLPCKMLSRIAFS
jgi:hypothetical protein